MDHFSSASDTIQRATQAWTSNKSIWTLSLFTGALLTGEQLQVKSNNLVNLCQHSLVLSAIRTRPCNLQITLFCCLGHLRCPAVTGRTRCLFIAIKQSRQKHQISQITSSHLGAPILLGKEKKTATAHWDRDTSEFREWEMNLFSVVYTGKQKLIPGHTVKKNSYRK